MEQALSNSDWQSLRRLLRSGDTIGRKLRMVLTRKTHGGMFLTLLMHAGLIRRITPEPVSTPLDALYSITAEGRVAAEYGYYDGEWSDEHGVCVATKGWMPVDEV